MNELDESIEGFKLAKVNLDIIRDSRCPLSMRRKFVQDILKIISSQKVTLDSIGTDMEELIRLCKD